MEIAMREKAKQMALKNIAEKFPKPLKDLGELLSDGIGSESKELEDTSQMTGSKRSRNIDGFGSQKAIKVKKLVV
jgi:hypothetical protein